MNKKKEHFDSNIKPLNLAVCVLFFEKVEQTVECIKSFLLSNVNIYILNNGSSSLARSILGKFCENYKQVKIFDSNKNLGVGVGRNYLINNTKEKWLFFVDSDIVVKTRNWLQILKNYISKYPNIEVFIPKLFNVHEERYVSYRSIRIEGNKAIYDLGIENDLKNTFPGGASIVNRKIFDRLGLYDEKMFIGLEDYELCIRGILIESPVKARMIHDIELLHTHRSLKNEEDKKATLTRYNANIIEKSHKRIAEKHNIILVSGWKNWITKQIEYTLKADVPLGKIRHIKKGQLKVVIGPVFDESGEVSQNILDIKKYSTHRVQEIPSKLIRTFTNKSNITKNIYKKLMNKIGLNYYDVLHSQVNPWFINLCYLSKKNTNKWTNTYHEIYFEEDYPEGLKPWQKEFNKFLLKVASKADIKISTSKWLHDYLAERYSIQSEIIPNGVDPDKCNNANPEKFTEKFKIKDFVLFVGNINEIKNPQIFVKLAAQIPDVIFLMLGKGLNKINLIKNYKVSIPENLFLIPEISHKDTLDAISACKVLVMTSKREGLPTVLLEAMGMGKPVVAPDHSGCKEVIRQKRL
jgi:glycosyltransferase involved in cell wall biosynthesis